jgi:hypothetical protein
MQVQSDAAASGGQYVMVAAGNNSQTAAPASGYATVSFVAPTAGTYKVWARVIDPANTDDSFWVRMDGGAWVNWNNIALGSTWHWDEVHDSGNADTVVQYSLAAGTHSLSFAYREDGAKLDRVLITDDLAFVPSGTGPAASSLSFEAEALTVTHSGVGTSLQADASSSGGQWISLNATATGSWMELTLPNVPAGSYTLKMKYKTNNNRGQLQLKVDGVSLGGTVDQYASPSTYPEATFGTVAFSAAGSHQVRLTVTGKNASSSSYVLSADRFTLP